MIHNQPTGRSDQNFILAYQALLDQSPSFAQGILQVRLGDLFRYCEDWQSSLKHYLAALASDEDVCKDGSVCFNISCIYTRLEESTNSRCFLILARNLPKHLPFEPFSKEYTKFSSMPFTGQSICECLVTIGVLREKHWIEDVERFLALCICLIVQLILNGIYLW